MLLKNDTRLCPKTASESNHGISCSVPLPHALFLCFLLVVTVFYSLLFLVILSQPFSCVHKATILGVEHLLECGACIDVNILETFHSLVSRGSAGCEARTQ